MCQSETETLPSLGTIIEALHESEINGSVSWFFDDVWRVFLGDPDNGIDTEATVYSSQEAAEWLRANAVSRHPHSELARRFPRSIVREHGYEQTRD